MAKYFVGGIMASSNDIFHYGVKGMKWGVRRYQNADGSYTDLGKKRNYMSMKKLNKKAAYKDTFQPKISDDLKTAIKNKVNENKQTFKAENEAYIKAVNETNKIFYEFENNKQLISKLADKMAKETINSYNNSNNEYDMPRRLRYNESQYNYESLFEEYKKYPRDYLFDAYLRENRKANDRWKHAWDEYNKRAKERNKVYDSIVDDILGKYGEKTISTKITDSNILSPRWMKRRVRYAGPSLRLHITEEAANLKYND